MIIGYATLRRTSTLVTQSLSQRMKISGNAGATMRACVYNHLEKYLLTCLTRLTVAMVEKMKLVSIATRDMDVWLVIVKQLTTLTQISYIAVSGNRI